MQNPFVSTLFQWHWWRYRRSRTQILWLLRVDGTGIGTISSILSWPGKQRWSSGNSGGSPRYGQRGHRTNIDTDQVLVQHRYCGISNAVGSVVDSITHDSWLGNASPKGIWFGMRETLLHNCEKTSDMLSQMGNLSPFRWPIAGLSSYRIVIRSNS